MLDLSYRKLNYIEIDTLIHMRTKQLKESCPDGTIDLIPAMKQFYEQHYLDHTFVSWVAVHNDTIVSTSGITLVERPPHFKNPSGKVGLLSNMYTEKEYRRKGIAKTLLNNIIEEARSWNCGVILIDGSDMGRLLYTDFGFQHHQNFLQYFL